MEPQQHRYHFNNVGIIKDIVHPNKAILHFKLSGKDEKAVLLSKVLTLDGKPLDESKQMSDVLKLNDTVEFDCHIYDKGGGVGSGKDKCNYFAMRAWKNSKEYERKMASKGGAPTGHHLPQPVFRNDVMMGTGWISELNPRKGVLTFDNHGKDERVLFLASKVWIFEKRLAAKQSLTELLSEGDPVQFEASKSSVEDQSTNYCPWFANVVWKGRRPTLDDHAPAGGHAESSSEKRRPSATGSDNNAASNSFSESEDHQSEPQQTSMPNGYVNEGVIKGIGVIAKIVNDKCGIIWWLKKANHLQSIWFEGKQTFVYGVNQDDKNLKDVFTEGDPVTFLAVKPTRSTFPTQWIAKQVLVTDSTEKVVTKFVQSAES